MIGLLAVHGLEVVSVGDDCVIRKWKMNENGTLNHVVSQESKKRTNLVFCIYGHFYVNFYEENCL